MRIETKAAREMSAFEKARTECVVTSSLYAYQIGTKWAEADWTVMVWEGEELVSNVHIVERIAQVGGPAGATSADWAMWQPRGSWATLFRGAALRLEAMYFTLQSTWSTEPPRRPR